METRLGTSFQTSTFPVRKERIKFSVVHIYTHRMTLYSQPCATESRAGEEGQKEPTESCGCAALSSLGPEAVDHNKEERLLNAVTATRFLKPVDIIFSSFWSICQHNYINTYSMLQPETEIWIQFFFVQFLLDQNESFDLKQAGLIWIHLDKNTTVPCQHHKRIVE